MHIFQLSHLFLQWGELPLSSFVQGVKGQKCHSLLGADKAESYGNLTFGLLVAKKKKEEQHAGSICEKLWRVLFIY